MSKLNVGKRYNVYKVKGIREPSFIKTFEDKDEACVLVEALAKADIHGQFEFTVYQEGIVTPIYSTWFSKERWK